MDFIAFKNKYQKKEVFKYNNIVNDKPKVSVCIQTYQHSDYIVDCIESIISQNTNFPFEILLGDDESTDGTREICIEYAKKYPQKIRLFLHHRENNIKIGGKPTGRFNFLYNLYSANGKYIAICEGDDYWTDPLKLQNQVDFLENNKDYSFCATNYQRLKKGVFKKVNLEGKRITPGNIFLKNSQASASLVFRYNIIKAFLSLKTNQVKAADWLLQSIGCVKYGPGKCLKFYSTVYRLHDKGVWSSYNRKEMGKAGVEVLKSFKTIFNDKKTQKLIHVAIKNRKSQYGLGLNSKLKKILRFKYI